MWIFQRARAVSAWKNFLSRPRMCLTLTSGRGNANLLVLSSFVFLYLQCLTGTCSRTPFIHEPRLTGNLAFLRYPKDAGAKTTRQSLRKSADGGCVAATHSRCPPLRYVAPKAMCAAKIIHTHKDVIKDPNKVGRRKRSRPKRPRSRYGQADHNSAPGDTRWGRIRRSFIAEFDPTSWAVLDETVIITEDRGPLRARASGRGGDGGCCML